MSRIFAGGVCCLLFLMAGVTLPGQDTAPKQPLVSVIGAVTALDADAHTVTVKQDKTAADYVIQLADTKTLLKVEPGAKDLKNAVRITAADLEVGDRVEVRAIPPADGVKRSRPKV